MIRAKKKLGQHFLESREITKKMVRAAGIKNKETVLEIGPGKGILTAELLNNNAKVTAVEKDSELILLLKNKFSEHIKNKKLILVESDIRDIDIAKLGLKSQSYKLVANIPYYITGELFRQFLGNEHQPSIIVFLIQKEVGQRIVARDGKESLLSISIKAYGNPIFVEKVSKNLFRPKPKVDSAILKIEKISKSNFKNLNEGWFFKILKAGFRHKRKKLMSNLSVIAEKPTLERSFSKLNIDPNIRAEDLDTEDWVSLSKSLIQR